jgi:hypothetical protein
MNKASLERMKTEKEVRDIITSTLEAQRVSLDGHRCIECGWHGEASVDGLVDTVYTHLIEKRKEGK